MPKNAQGRRDASSEAPHASYLPVENPQVPELTYPEDWAPVKEFLGCFPESIFCYIPDSSSANPHIVQTKGEYISLEKQKSGIGIFFSVNGMRTTPGGQRRRAEDLYCLNACYVDIDWPDKTKPPTDEQLKSFKHDVLEHLMSLEMDEMGPSIINETKNGYHAFWLFDKPFVIDAITKTVTNEDGTKTIVPDEDKIQRLLLAYSQTQEAIIDRLQGDPNADGVARVLRVPQTYHLKDPNNPFLIKNVLFATDKRFSLKRIREYFTGTKYPDPKGFDTSGLSDNGLVWHSASGDAYTLTSEVVQELNARYPKIERPSIRALMAKDGIVQGSRNNCLLVAVSAMRECGMSEAQVISYFDHYNGISIYEIRSVIKGAFRRAAPWDFGWNHPCIAPRVTDAERARVTAIVSVVAAKQRDVARLEAREINKLKKEDAKAEANFEAIHAPGVAIEKAEIKEREVKAKMDAKIDKETQKILYKKYEDMFMVLHPNIRYLDTVGFYSFCDGAFTPVSHDEMRGMFLRSMLKDGLLDFRTNTSVENKLSCLQSKEEVLLTRDDDASYELISVKSGVLNVLTGELTPHDLNVFIPCRVDATWDETLPIEHACPRWTRFIDEVTCGDKNLAALLEEVAGYCLTQNITFQKAFILLGDGSNGKSTFINILSRLLTTSCSSLTLRDLQSQFTLSRLFGMRLNVIEEIHDGYGESDQMKKIITGAQLTADRKFLTPLSFRPYVKIVFAVNSLPKINDTSHGFYRRFDIVPFKATFGDNEKDPMLESKLWAERNGILRAMVRGYRRLISNNAFTRPDSVTNANEDFKEANSPLVEFLFRTYTITSKEEASNFPQAIQDVFDRYQAYARSRGYGAKAFQSFLREMKTLSHRDLKHVRVDVKGSLAQTIIGLKLREGASPTFKNANLWNG